MLNFKALLHYRSVSLSLHTNTQGKYLKVSSKTSEVHRQNNTQAELQNQWDQWEWDQKINGVKPE